MSLRVVVGPGRLGRNLVAVHCAADEDVRVLGRRPGAWQDEVRRAGATAAELDLAAAATGPARAGLRTLIGESNTPTTLLLAVPDDALPTTAEALAQAWPGPTPELVVHFSGLHDLGLLDAWQERGAACAGLHPLRPFPAEARSDAFAGAPVTVLAASEAARVAADRLLEVWNARALHVDPRSDRRRYHLACCLAANHLTALLGEAARLAAPAIGERGAHRALAELAAAAVDAFAAEGAPAALTGPVARGDVQTLQAHFDALDPREAARYRQALPPVVALARAAGRLDAEQAAAMVAAFGLDPATCEDPAEER